MREMIFVEELTKAYNGRRGDMIVKAFEHVNHCLAVRKDRSV